MTFFISWSVDQDSRFRQEYFDTFNEEIQQDPIQKDDRLLVGSSRATEDGLRLLKLKGFDVKYDKY